MEIITFSLAKVGEKSSSNQDCFAINLEKGLIALSDGAGSSLYPQQWAEILVNTFCQSSEDPMKRIRESLQKWLLSPQKQWQQYYIQKITDSSLKWWQKGSESKTYAAATFLGFSIDSKREQWQVITVGDSCLFYLKAETQDLMVFPPKTSDDFKSVTQCLMSSPDLACPSAHFEQGSYQQGDKFLLATDALSQWILKNYENQGREWQKCFNLKESAEFIEILTQLREEQKIKNDDTTFILLSI